MENTQYYDYEAIEQAKIVRDIIKELMSKHGDVLQQRYYYKHLQIYFELLQKDLPNEEDCLD